MKLPTIPTPEELLDKGFKRGKKAADLKRSERMPKHIKGKIRNLKTKREGNNYGKQNI